MILQGLLSDNMQLTELLSSLESIADGAELVAFMEFLVDAYDLKTCAYMGFDVTARPEQGPYLAVTYTQEWIEHYKAQQYVNIDPAVHIGMRRILPTDWENFDLRSDDVRRLFGDAIEFGLGRHGISLPVHGQHCDKALVSISCDAGILEWRHRRLQYMRDFQMLALYIHQAVLRLEGRVVEQMRLSPRERECLQWAAEGKTAWETAVILGLSERTVRCYLEGARYKLGAANNTQAVNKAGKASLLTQLP